MVRRYRERRLGEIAGLGARGISEIEAGLVLAGLLLTGSPPVRQQPRTRATAPALTAVAADEHHAFRWAARRLNLAGIRAIQMSDSENVTAMQHELGRQLAALRREAGLTQHDLAALAGFSRSTVSLAEIGRQPQAREFWQACDKALDTGGALTAGADQIDAVRDAEQHAAAWAAQEAREARALAALAAARRHGGVRAGVTAVQACPHCGGEVTVLTTLIPGTGPAREAARQQG